MDGVAARFDDLVADAAFELSDPVRTVEAYEAAGVVIALREAERAARDGLWVAGFVSYEAASGIDPGLAVTNWPPGHPLAGLPLVWFGAFRRRAEVPPVADANAAADPQWRLDRDEAWHRKSVAAIRNDIEAGEYYQLNLTARLSATIEDPHDLYATMCLAQGGGYHALISTGRHTVISSSPELFFQVSGRDVITRPMKGTAPRGRWSAEDRAHGATLRTSSKQRAENAMIVDLVRNDLAKVAEVGTVTVPDLFGAERYPTLWQLTSTVQARLRPEIGLADLFAALFPSGSITGAPKRAAMTAIARLEHQPRGVYCGAVGVMSPSGDQPAARFSVAIRTATRDDATGYTEYGTGGGITWSSTAADEWAELRLKARVLDRPSRPATLLETLGFEPGRGLVRLDRHLRRLAESAEYFGISCDVDSIVDAASAAVEQRATPARVRIVLRRDGAVQVDVAELPASSASVLLGIATTPVNSRDVLLFHKHGDRCRYDELRAQCPTADDVVLWNERDEITETTIANLAVRLEGRWWTPPLQCGLLPGVERARLVDAGVLAERVVSLAELRDADALAVLNSLRGWRAARLEDSASLNPGIAVPTGSEAL